MLVVPRTAAATWPVLRGPVACHFPLVVSFLLLMSGEVFFSLLLIL